MLVEHLITYSALASWNALHAFLYVGNTIQCSGYQLSVYAVLGGSGAIPNSIIVSASRDIKPKQRKQLVQGIEVDGALMMVQPGSVDDRLHMVYGRW